MVKQFNYVISETEREGGKGQRFTHSEWVAGNMYDVMFEVICINDIDCWPDERNTVLENLPI